MAYRIGAYTCPSQETPPTPPTCCISPMYPKSPDTHVHAMCGQGDAVYMCMPCADKEMHTTCAYSGSPQQTPPMPPSLEAALIRPPCGMRRERV